MKRRDFLPLIATAATWPLAVRAQAAELPAVGFLNAASAESYARMSAAFLKGLGETGYSDGRNVRIEYRWADGRNERLPALAADLIQRRVAVIAATSTPAALAARAATSVIPIVFETAADPVQIGLVNSLNRPGGNVTGVTQTNVEVAPKRLELLRELCPAARVVGLMVNPDNPALAKSTVDQLSTAARSLGLRLEVFNAGRESDFEPVFAKLGASHVDGLVVGGGDPLFASQSGQLALAALAVQHAVPVIGAGSGFAAAGGLSSYGADITESYRLAGVYTGRILKGDKPADLPVQQATKVEFIVNLKAAKALGLTVPLPLLGRADAVIE